MKRPEYNDPLRIVLWVFLLLIIALLALLFSLIVEHNTQNHVY